GEAQWTQRPLISEDDSTVGIGPKSQAATLEILGLGQQSEGAGRQQLTVRLGATAPALRADRRMREVDGAVEPLGAGLDDGTAGLPADLEPPAHDQRRRWGRRLSELG